MPGEDAMDPMYIDRVETRKWTAPATRIVVHAESACRILRRKAARGR